MLYTDVHTFGQLAIAWEMNKSLKILISCVIKTLEEEKDSIIHDLLLSIEGSSLEAYKERGAELLNNFKFWFE